MKMNRILALLLCMILLCGCSGRAVDSYDSAEAETWASTQEMKYDDVAYGGVTSSSGLSTYSDPNAKLIRTVYLDAQTREYDALITGLDAKISELGGYVESRDAYNGSEYYGRSSRYCNLTVRIPADRLDEFVTHVNENCNVTNTSETVENITLEYTDTASRVEALETEQTRLLELLESAQNLTEILEIEARLSDVRYELTSYASQLRVMDNMVTYATIYLNIDEVEKLTPVEEPTVWQRISEGFMDSVEDVWDWLVDFAVWLAVNSPWLAIWALALTAVFFAAKALGRRHRRKPVDKAPREEKTE